MYKKAETLTKLKLYYCDLGFSFTVSKSETTCDEPPPDQLFFARAREALLLGKFWMTDK